MLFTREEVARRAKPWHCRWPGGTCCNDNSGHAGGSDRKAHCTAQTTAGEAVGHEATTKLDQWLVPSGLPGSARVELQACLALT
jgi:hypothetical protein